MTSMNTQNQRITSKIYTKMPFSTTILAKVQKFANTLCGEVWGNNTLAGCCGSVNFINLYNLSRG